MTTRRKRYDVRGMDEKVNVQCYVFWTGFLYGEVPSDRWNPPLGGRRGGDEVIEG